MNEHGSVMQADRLFQEGHVVPHPCGEVVEQDLQLRLYLAGRASNVERRRSGGARPRPHVAEHLLVKPH